MNFALFGDISYRVLCEYSEDLITGQPSTKTKILLRYSVVSIELFSVFFMPFSYNVVYYRWSN